MKFTKSLSLGIKGENQVINLCRLFDFVCTRPKKNERKFWDLCIRGHGIYTKIEIKNDIYEEKSGNIAIEVFNDKSNEPSGIYITKAFLWIHILHDGIYLTTCKKLRTFIQQNKPDRIIMSGGDKNSNMLLYSRDRIIPLIFYPIDILTKEEFITLIKILSND